MQLKRTDKIAFAITIILIFSTTIFIYPNLLVSERADEQYAAIRSLEMFYEAEQLYFSQNKKYGTLGELIDAGLIDRSFLSGNRFNYLFVIEPEDSRHDAFATPVWNWETGLGGERRLSFYINDQNTFTRAEKQGGRAGANDEPIPR